MGARRQLITRRGGYKPAAALGAKCARMWSRWWCTPCMCGATEDGGGGGMAPTSACGAAAAIADGAGPSAGVYTRRVAGFGGWLPPGYTPITIQAPSSLSPLSPLSPSPPLPLLPLRLRNEVG